MKTPRPSTLDNKARSLVKLLYDKCSTCNSREDLQWAHVFGGYRNATRWHPLDYARQCPRCNANHNDNPRPYMRWFEAEYGPETLDKLERLHMTPGGVKLLTSDYRALGVALDGCIREARQGMTGPERLALFSKYFGELKTAP